MLLVGQWLRADPHHAKRCKVRTFEQHMHMVSQFRLALPPTSSTSALSTFTTTTTSGASSASCCTISASNTALPLRASLLQISCFCEHPGLAGAGCRQAGISLVCRTSCNTPTTRLNTTTHNRLRLARVDSQLSLYPQLSHTRSARLAIDKALK